MICGSEHAACQAANLGIGASHILQTSGMILNPVFYEPSGIDRDVARERLGLRPGVPTGLVLFGGEGSGEMLKIAEALNRPGNPVQLILLCGENHALADELRAMYPHISDASSKASPAKFRTTWNSPTFLIGKPGPGSISEALAKKLPVIGAQSNAWTLAHERYNADWVKEQGFGLVVRNFSTDIQAAVETMVAHENYSRFRERVAAMHNTAVYEIPALLEKVMTEESGQCNLVRTKPHQHVQPALQADYSVQSLPDSAHSA